ncbi:hypothetical protein [Lacipirellula parvula]|uniref:DUF3426 domain-containing protein n=1 Tax=Lacipirellula parvula TaxID=2650471 RepID=A0A5K7XAB2_9BACT|nr:hypothetical protein [Lacipirellula parvula]BBO33640.1 hypothetical protein PLANPX_3252 [Lacipirellula parvula]
MAIRVVCPGCGKGINAPDNRAGTRAKCPGCGQQLTIGGLPADASLPQQLAVSAPPPPPPDPIATPAPVADHNFDFPTTPKEKSTQRKQWPAWAPIAGVGALCLIVGFFLGREYLKWEIRSAFEKAAEGFQEGLAKSLGGGGTVGNIDKRDDRTAELVPKVKILGASIRTVPQQFGGDELIVNVKVRNDSNEPISAIYFAATVKSPNRAVPWAEVKFSKLISGGLERGETQELEYTPNQFDGGWYRVKEAPKDAKFIVSVRDVDWPTESK